MLRLAKTAFGVVVLGSLLVGGSPALAATTPAGGTIKVWSTPSTSGNGGTIVITGVVGDYGKTAKVNTSGKADKKGTYTKFFLKYGTILVDSSAVQTAIQKVAAPPADLNDVTCSGSAVATADVPIVSGTKAYAGITGSVSVSIDFALVLPLTKGKCDLNTNANPVAQYGSITGSGTVSFS